MPTYEYQCNTCGNVMELFQSITAKAKRKLFCEHCGQERAVQRLISGGGAVLFKGSGFYQTDYRSDSYKKAQKAETESKSDAKSTGGKDAPAKPEPPKPAADTKTSSGKSDD